MEKFDFILTDDNSVGLYDKSVEDILHSRSGALKESYEKFILPSHLTQLLKKEKNINILDICFGVGYNTKSALNFVDSSNINIDAVEINQTLMYLSLFIKDGLNDNVQKMFLFYQLLNQGYKIDDMISFLFSFEEEKIFSFFDPFVVHLFKCIKSDPNKIDHKVDLQAFLHNIYYKYISTSMENCTFSNKYNNVSISFYNDDARLVLKNLKNTYDIVFLDAYSPQKDPTLWTIDFLSLIKQKMNNDSVLVTYSKSTPVRSALIQLGFFVGKTYINDVDMGTVASLNKSLVPDNLADFDFALYKSRCGIVYKDENLNNSPQKIINLRNNEQNSSTLISHTALLKLYKNK